MAWKIKMTKGDRVSYRPVLSQTGTVTKDQAERQLAWLQKQIPAKEGVECTLVEFEEEKKVTPTRPTCPDCGRSMVVEGRTSYCEYCEG